jgi:ribonucleotide reductase alpha subunit
MVVVDIDHPDIEAYIDWKVKEEAEGRGPCHRLEDRSSST